MKRLMLLCLSLLVILSACASIEISIEDPWARSSTLGGNSAIYMIINNPTSENDILLSASSSIADSVELHMSKMSEETGMMMMQQQDNIPIPNKASINLQPGGLHIMLIDLNDDLIAGDTFTVTLQFQKAGDIIVEVPVQNP